MNSHAMRACHIVVFNGEERQLDTINDKYLPTNQALAFAQVEHLGVGSSAALAVAITGIKDRESEFVAQHVVDRVLETSGQQLLVQIKGKEARAAVDCFIANHDKALN